jgi:hypothetical protein
LAAQIESRETMGDWVAVVRNNTDISKLGKQYRAQNQKCLLIETTTDSYSLLPHQLPNIHALWCSQAVPFTDWYMDNRS